jgi:type II secretory pathway pseudopilin PulG
MMYFIGSLLIIVLAVVIVALSYRGKAKAEQHHAELQRQRAEAAEFANANRQQLDKELQSLHETHRKETLDATTPTHLAARTDFDNDWSGNDGLRGSETGSDYATGTAATDSTGAAAHPVSRTDLSE